MLKLAYLEVPGIAIHAFAVIHLFLASGPFWLAYWPTESCLFFLCIGVFVSYVVVKGVSGEEGKAPRSLSELEFTINRRLITGPLASSAERCLEHVGMNERTGNP